MTYYVRPRFQFYPKEVFDILVSLIVLIVAFSILMSYPLSLKGFIGALPVATLSVITAFFLHEMAHKYMAIRYGFPAAFQAWYPGLLFALFSAFLGFLFAAPGAVMIYGLPTKRENGIIAAAGPSMNIALGFILLIISLLTPAGIAYVTLHVAYLNFFLAFFNLLPFPPMDGLKIITWSPSVYALLLAGSIGGIVLLYL